MQHHRQPTRRPDPAESEAWLCQDTSWGWLRRIGAAPTAGQQRLRMRRGYEPPATKVGG